MKTIFKSFKLATIVALFSFLQTGLKAQCANIFNSSNCDVKVSITIYTRPPMCTAICQTFPSVPIPPGGVFPVNCNCNACDIVVTVLAVGGGPTTPPNASAGSTSNPAGTTFSSMPPCTATQIMWGGTSCKIF